MQLAYWVRTSPRYALTLVESERFNASFEHFAAVVIWSLLEPLFDDLTIPVMMRAGQTLGQKTADEEMAVWQRTIVPVYEALGAGDQEVRAFAPASGWAELDARGVIARREALIEAWGRADPEAVRRLRTYRVGRLVEHYYDKARDGVARRRGVIDTSEFERPLTAYFGGDWLALLDFLGEQPATGEQVTTALPRTRLTATSSRQAVDIAAAQGVPPEEVARMLATFWGQSQTETPIEQRMSALEELWSELDGVYEQQPPGGKSLFGLMGTGYASGVGYGGPGAGLERELLSADLLLDLRRLWGMRMLPRAPGRLVSEPYWISAAAHAFGPAIGFWHHVALNAWALSEGSGRVHSDLDDFEDFLKKQTVALNETGFPANPELFAALREADSKLARAKTVWDMADAGDGWQMGVSHVAGRGGFETLRDIITLYRRAWAEQHLSPYLEAQWKHDLLGAGEAYHRHAADKGKLPTVKQFAAMASGVAATWFGGDLTGVYRALGMRSPIPTPTYSRVLPENVKGFQTLVRRELDAMTTPASDSTSEKADRKACLSTLTARSLKWVELCEAVGGPPELKQFGSADFRNNSAAISGDIELAWRTYCDVIQRAIAVTPAADAGATSKEPRSTPRPRLEAAPTASNSPAPTETPHLGAPSSESGSLPLDATNDRKSVTEDRAEPPQPNERRGLLSRMGFRHR